MLYPSLYSLLRRYTFFYLSLFLPLTCSISLYPSLGSSTFLMLTLFTLNFPLPCSISLHFSQLFFAAPFLCTLFHFACLCLFLPHYLGFYLLLFILHPSSSVSTSLYLPLSFSYLPLTSYTSLYLHLPQIRAYPYHTHI